MKQTPIVIACMTATNVFAGNIIMIDPDGIPNAEGPIAVTSLGWNNGNAITLPTATGVVVPAPSGAVQTYGQGALANFNDAASNPVGGLGLNSTYEWTYVFGLEEIASSTPVGASTLAQFLATAGGDNFFKVYYSPVNASNVNGTGFDDPVLGTLILSGSILPFDPLTGSGASTFLGTTAATGILDQNGTDNYAGLTSTQGVGTSKFAGVIKVGFYSPAFFLDPVGDISIILDTFQSQPFLHTDPSSCFTDGAGNPVNGAGPNNAGGACASGIGPVNGISGPGVMFETRATNDFLFVPEPASLALSALGLMSMLGCCRRPKVPRR